MPVVSRDDDGGADEEMDGWKLIIVFKCMAMRGFNRTLVGMDVILFLCRGI